ncbi:hypothetical protein [Massilia sp. TS11]|uniref:hypothetical protein n=1 Tax=Massilia sp. TS11 TaxID=2908003 RepID=UPI001EDADFF8|nr:hypothetical protein [Massilia sp. TS11]MCG2586509.1 hypothetical protein [Massilia sp. TS11]
MHPRYYRDLIVRAVENRDDDMLDSIANHLADCEEGKTILRAKGYGLHGMAVAALARQVPASGQQPE